MKIIFLVEGRTEKVAIRDFLSKCISHRLPNRPPIGIRVQSSDGNGNLHNEAAALVGKYLDGPDGDQIVAIVSLLDLYEAGFFPDNKMAVTDRIQWGRDYMVQRVNNPRYRHYFAVHETEAWLLSAPSIFPSAVRDTVERVKSRPETVNSHEPPAKILSRAYISNLHRGYDKVTDGRNLFPKLLPEVALAACPNLAGMIDELVAMVNRRQTGDLVQKRRRPKRN